METIRLSSDPNADDLPEEFRTEMTDVFAEMQQPQLQNEPSVAWEDVFPGLQENPRPQAPQAAGISSEQLSQVFPGLEPPPRPKVNLPDPSSVPLYLPPPTGPQPYYGRTAVRPRAGFGGGTLLLLVLLLLLWQ